MKYPINANLKKIIQQSTCNFVQLFFCFLIVGIFSIMKNYAQTPHSNYGTIKRHEKFASAFIPARTIDVWLPSGYSEKKKYSVIYMHDGEMLFDSSITWNKQSWHADRTLFELKKKGNIKDCIIVGIWNGGKNRHAEFCPQQPFESLPAAYIDSLIVNAKRVSGNEVFSKAVYSDNYLKFIVVELKPFIDKTYSTLKSPANTFVAGSSMGGLISIYAICEYPNVFGGAACLSTHWPVLFSNDNNPFPKLINDYLIDKLPKPGKHKIYFDYGDQTLDSLYKIHQVQIDQTMRKKGFTKKTWITKEFTGADHSEKSWSRRLSIPFGFLLSN